MMPEKGKVTIITWNAIGDGAFQHPHAIRFTDAEELFFNIIYDIDDFLSYVPLPYITEVYTENCKRDIVMTEKVFVKIILYQKFRSPVTVLFIHLFQPDKLFSDKNICLTKIIEPVCIHKTCHVVTLHIVF